jgi:DNA-binding IclR family transcriptional regulator
MIQRSKYRDAGGRMSEESKTGVIKKAFSVINAFVDVQPEWGVRDLAKHLGLPTSTLHRFLFQLQEGGIIEFNSVTNKYKIGIEMIRISSVISSNIDVKRIARPFIEKLVDQHKETICLVLYHHKLRNIMFVDKVAGADPLQYVINFGEFLPVPYGSSGKSILAFLDSTEFELICQKENLSNTQIMELKKDLDTIRKNGFASTQGERIPGSKGIATPLFNSLGQPIGSLIYTVPIVRFNPAMEPEISASMKAASTEISAILGYRGAGGQTWNLMDRSSL